MRTRKPLRKVIEVGLLFLLAWCLVSSPTVAQDSPEPQEDLQISVKPNQQQAPGMIEVKIRIPSHKDNIWFCVGYRIEEMPPEIEESRRSCQQLNGVYSPKNYWFQYKNIPSENYRAFVEVYRAPYRLAGKAQAKFVVTPS